MGISSERFVPMILLLVVVAIAVASVLFSKWRAEKLRDKVQEAIEGCPFELFAEGEFDRASRCEEMTNHSLRVGAMVHSERKWSSAKHWTAIYLKDGRSWVFGQHIDTPFKSGTRIKVLLRKADGLCRLEKA